MKAASGAATAFDVTTKGILHAAFEVSNTAIEPHRTICVEPLTSFARAVAPCCQLLCTRLLLPLQPPEYWSAQQQSCVGAPFRTVEADQILGVLKRLFGPGRTVSDPRASVMLLLQRGDFSRLRDSEGKPPGVMGWWPSHATTFLENHDTVCHLTDLFSARFSWQSCTTA